LRALAKEWRGELKTFLFFPDEYYEVTFLKCQLVGALPYEEFVAELDGVVGLIDNWATCDCFRAPCIKKYREEFLPVIEKYLQDGREFVVRYALVSLLEYYMQEEYLPFIYNAVLHADAQVHYIKMGAAWLLAEVLVHFYESGVCFLRENALDENLRRIAIQKARESFRLTAEQKEELKALKV
ncbi:MAG: DNA alkylation repair protein, partial [Clostridia bacterium]|nr:DNA alkylation repair protein [Clostridia bacterium]